jgi:hypothetical protein
MNRPSEHDDTYGVTLLRPLRGEPGGEPRVDLARAIAEGRRRRLRHWWAGGAAIAALTATAVAGGPLAVTALRGDVVPTVTVSPTTSAAASAFPPTCTVAALPTGGITSTGGVLVVGGDPTGRWLLGSGGAGTVLIWRDGQLAFTQTAGQPPFENTTESLADINSHGVAVGRTGPGPFADGPTFPSVYRDGVFRRLPGGSGSAEAINESGMIVGVLDAEGGTRLVRWSSDTAEPITLASSKGYPETIDIDDDGTVVAIDREYDDASPGQRSVGYRWDPAGVRHPLPLPVRAGTRASHFEPLGIRNGWIRGMGWFAESADGTSFSGVPYRYDTRTGTFDQLPKTVNHPHAINAMGWIIGTDLAYYDGKKVLDLPKLSDPAPATISYEARALSDDGRTIAGHYHKQGIPSRPLIWRCD